MFIFRFWPWTKMSVLPPTSRWLNMKQKENSDGILAGDENVLACVLPPADWIMNMKLTEHIELIGYWLGMKMFWPASYPLLIEYEAEREYWWGTGRGWKCSGLRPTPLLIEYEEEREYWWGTLSNLHNKTVMEASAQPSNTIKLPLYRGPPPPPLVLLIFSYYTVENKCYISYWCTYSRLGWAEIVFLCA